MSTRDEAIRVIRQQTLVSDLATSKDIARKLEYAGLLVPDTDHPATLTTEADFAAAPVGTVVLHPWGAAIKHDEDEWGVTGNDMRRRNDTVGDMDEEEPLTVLRWGTGKDTE
nr:MAG TPA_asm: hypothetical protein [Caudoviricetes sp.]